MSLKRLTPIEATVLGIAYRLGSATTYALMKELSTSTLTWYRAKAGTAYPLVDRLIKNGFLESATASGPKGEKLLQVTDLGEEAFLRWLAEPPPEAEILQTVDLVRLRMFYLVSIAPDDRQKVLDTVEKALEKQLEEARKTVQFYLDCGGQFSALANLGLVYEAEARLKWLHDIREQVIAAPILRPPKPPR